MASQPCVVFACFAKRNRIAFRAIRAKTMLAKSTSVRLVCAASELNEVQFGRLLWASARNIVLRCQAASAAQTNAFAYWVYNLDKKDARNSRTEKNIPGRATSAGSKSQLVGCITIAKKLIIHNSESNG